MLCLQLYGGLNFAANLDRSSDAFRRADEAPAPPAPTCPRAANTDPGARQSDGDDAAAERSQDDEFVAVVSEHAPGAAQQRCGRRMVAEPDADTASGSLQHPMPPGRLFCQGQSQRRSANEHPKHRWHQEHVVEGVVVE